ncbi:hypothetical protein C922_05829 [Plasmodium inui San Antonio 1]|uniref:Uncharacterized protein n=1 Tax=Plasmodium inui San Antonio 1 TaxID=1237626 RepID=W6ZWY9_9APIC|nr:hypothetical protein C922_05829 [Plasmodium inui San Antonio 1]EUD63790.1 hypothetical protein C922_05829 [Plasmodium inui San Antonio 1]
MIKNSHTGKHLDEPAAVRSIDIKKMAQDNLFKIQQQRSNIRMARKTSIFLKKIPRRKIPSRGNHLYKDEERKNILKVQHEKKDHSDVTQEKRNNQEGQHHKKTGRKGIIMKQDSRRNRDEDATNKGIFIRMLREMSS